MNKLDSNIIFLNDLASRFKCNPIKILEYGINGKLDIYAILNSTGRIHHSEERIKNGRHSFKCIYNLNKNDLLSLKANKNLSTFVEFKYHRNCDRNGKNIDSNEIFGFQTDSDRWDSFTASENITINNLFVYDDENLALVIHKNERNDYLINPTELPKELRLAVSVYYEFWHNKPEETNPAPIESIRSFLTDEDISKQSFNRINIISKPEKAKRGGSPRTDWKTYLGKSQKN